MDYDINEHGVEGRQVYKVFIPKCCLECWFCDSETTQDGWGETFYYCTMGVKFPVKKGTCKRQRK